MSDVRRVTLSRVGEDRGHRIELLVESKDGTHYLVPVEKYQAHVNELENAAMEAGLKIERLRRVVEEVEDDYRQLKDGYTAIRVQSMRLRKVVEAAREYMEGVGRRSTEDFARRFIVLRDALREWEESDE